MYSLIFFLVRIWLGRKQHVTIDDRLLQGLKAPYILLSNHESFEDFYYISKMAHPRRPSYLVNEYYCTRPILKTMAKRGGILSKKLFTRDMSTGVRIMRTIRSGYPVIIFPEGRLSPDGRSNPIVENGAAFYRRLNVPLVLVRIDGAYYAHPKWRRKTFPSDIRVSVQEVLQPEQIKGMTDEQLEEQIRASLFNDASAHVSTRYPQPDRAVGLETLLYRCIDCGALYRTAGVGNEVVCRVCRSRHQLDEYYHFSAAPGTIPGWYDIIRRLEAEKLDQLSLHTAVRTKIFGADGGPIRWEDGECALDPKAFRYRSDAKSFEIPVEKLPALAFSCGEEFELYHGNELHYFYPTEERNQVARWALAVDLMAERRNALTRDSAERTSAEA